MRKSFLKTGLFWVWLALIIVVLDRFSKTWVVNNLFPTEPLTILPVFNLTLAHNTGAAFSFLNAASGWQNIFLGGLAFAVSLVIIFWLGKLPKKELWTSAALAFILGGAIGNIWDRVQYGFVIDFLHFHLGDLNFAIFNVADAAICVGATMLLVKWVLMRK